MRSTALLLLLLSACDPPDPVVPGAGGSGGVGAEGGPGGPQGMGGPGGPGGPDGGGPEGGGPGGPGGPDGGGAIEFRPTQADGPKFAVTIGCPTAQSGQGKVFVVGYRPEDMPPRGGGAPKGEPKLAWASESVAWTWPMNIEVPLVGGLVVQAILDVSGDGRPGGGDLVSSPISVAEPPPAGLQFSLDHSIGGAEGPAGGPDGGPPGAQGGGAEGNLPSWLSAGAAPPGTGAAAPAEGMQGGPPPAAGTAPASKSPQSSGGPAAVSLQPLRVGTGAPGPWTGAVLVAAFRPGRLQGGMPADDGAPDLFWTSGSVAHSMPTTLTVPVYAGYDVLVVLDDNGDGRPGPGDRRAAALSAIQPTQSPVDITANQSWPSGR